MSFLQCSFSYRLSTFLLTLLLLSMSSLLLQNSCLLVIDSASSPFAGLLCLKH